MKKKFLLRSNGAVSKIVLLSVLLSFSSMLNAQTWLWARSETVSGVGSAMCVDGQGNIYTTGYTSGLGAIGTLSITTACNAYVAKYSPAGTLIWARSFPFTAINYGTSYGVACNAAGDVYITGTFMGTVVIGTQTFVAYTAPNNAFYSDMFVVKYDAAGNLIWANVYGANTGNECGYSACVASNGDLLITGTYGSSTLAIGSTTLAGGGNRYFIARFAANGTPVWAISSGPGYANAFNLDMDANGDLYICGEYFNQLVAGTTTLTSSGSSDYNFFIAKYSSSGTFQWIRGGGGLLSDKAYAVDADPAGNVYLTGGYQSPTLAIGATTLISVGISDAFIAKYDATGNPLWAKNIGSAGFEVGRVVRSYNGGFFLAGDVAPLGSCTLVIGTSSISPLTINDTWLARFDASGNPSGFVSSDKGSGGGGGLGFSPLGMLLDTTACTLSLAKYFISSTIFGTFTLNATGSASPFVAKLSVPFSTLALSVSGNMLFCGGNSATLTASGATNYTWTSGPASYTNVITPLISSAYTVTGATGCAMGTAVALVTVIPSPTIQVTGLTNLCVGQQTQLNATGANSYTWSTGAQTSSISLTPATSTTILVSGTGSTNCSSTKTISIQVNACLGLEENQSLDVRIYPNPTGNMVYVEMNTMSFYSLTLEDLYGRSLLHVNGEGSTAFIDLSQFPQGVYLIRLTSSAGKKQTRLIRD
jgi:hypothetical protein